jgi:hypothetical protein
MWYNESKRISISFLLLLPRVLPPPGALCLWEDKMKNVRKRFTIPADQLQLAEEYAKATNRTLAELIVEALFQARHRHVRKDEKRLQNRLEDRFPSLRRKSNS